MRTHTRLLLGLVAGASALAIATSTSPAADMPAARAPVHKAPALVLGAVDWSGFYGGLHLGWGWTQTRANYDDVGDTGGIHYVVDGLNAGGQLGYNWQIGRTVYGVEIDGSWLDHRGGRTDIEGDRQRTTSSSLASARFRTGVAADNTLLYSTIGVGYVRSKFRVVEAGVPASTAVNGFGLVTGFGAEWAYGPNWSVRAEYLNYMVDKRRNIPALTPDSDATDYVKIDNVHIIRVAANYRWGGAGAAVMSAPAANFAGAHAGVHGGYGWSRIPGTHKEFFDNGSFDFDPKGFIGGGQIGYSWQSGAWVSGVEIDGTWSGMSDSRTTNDPTSEKLETTLLASARLRGGIVVENKHLYLTAGVGYARSAFKVADAAAVPTSAKYTITSWGPVVGSGVEWAFAPNWNLRLEGLTYLFDNRESMNTLTSLSHPFDFIKQSTVSVIRVGLNYRH